MKTITIRLPDVEAAMLQEMKPKNRDIRDISGLLVAFIRSEYAKQIDSRRK